MTASNLFKRSTLLLCIGLAFGLSACGGGDSTANHAAGELSAEQSIVINNGAEPESLDPHKVSGVPELTCCASCWWG